MRSQWQTGTIGQCAEVRARIGWRGLSSREYQESGPFLIAGKHISDGKILWDHCDHITPARYQESPEIILRPKDVIISKDGTIGRVARIDSLPGDATINGTMMLVRPGPVLDYKFLSHVLQGRRFTTLVEERISGSSIPHLFQRDIVKFPIALPSATEQRRIAEILDSIDEEISEARSALAKLITVRDAVIRSRLSTIYSTAPAVPLEQVANVDRGRFSARPRNDPAYYGGKYWFIQTGDVANSRGEIIRLASQTLNEIGLKTSREFPSGTVAITIAATIGETAILGVPMCFPDSVVGVVARDGYEPRFLERCLNRAKPRLEACAPQSAQKNINLQDLRPLLIPDASRDTQIGFAELWDNYDEQRNQMARGLAKLQALKRSLADDLLSGSIQVPDEN
ncbi:hypothetical protein HEK616_66480 [Streptomyces nigrescens]|uniref:Type I restriction modification DNA specificity domain-containing protein n=1 Tax=Streptomyces nigrescens TaxID=1920 RepID=A0ABN6R6U0_STRNI|nr:restriction endonuclease subunit S [Streptomyces nigrescens]BDM73161.1 hypothetical protein HEK616_66480 [Streptomyces nigrescens]